MNFARAAVVALVLSLTTGREAAARPITYMLDCVISGQLGGAPFTGRRLNVFAVSDTRLVTADPARVGGTVADIITAGSYIAGVGFIVGAVVKFKQHKDNPTQIRVILRDGPAAGTVTLASPALAGAELDELIRGVDVRVGTTGPFAIPLARDGQPRRLEISDVEGGCKFRAGLSS